MRKVIALTLAPVIAVAPALAAPGVITSNVNFRSGPGTNYSSIKTLSAGTAVDIGDCEASGSWCAITVKGQRGFVSGRYLEESQDPKASNTWPRAFETNIGRMVLYQPQFTEWTDFKTIEALVAAQFVKSSESSPHFGVIGLKGKTTFDEDADDIVISDITVTELNFSGLSREDLASLAVETGKLLPTGPITVSEARVTASLAEQKRMTDVSGLKADPPPIFISKTPAVLVQTDGAPVYAPVKGKTGLSFVVNTNWDLFRIDDGGALYLRNDTHWLTASAIDGPWKPVTALPSALTDLPDESSWADARASVPPEPYKNGAIPKIVISDKPAEMIIFTGEPALQDVPRSTLQWASNTESDVFFDKAAKQWYVLLSGRWFRAPSLEGPWTFATPDLPADFRNLPEDAPYYAVRASVPGTSESAEARLKASIPTTARVETGSITPKVSYTGDPQFSPIETTDLTYATNTTDTVIKVGDRYFLLQDGVWFVADNPNGPWQLAREIPDAIYQIPPSSPVYNVTYVRVYETEPDAVWYGYTMGYLFGFLAWGTYVYGTGWGYPPYWYNWPGYGYPIYYPRPATWGIGAYYNPVRGAYGRYGYAYGPYRGIAGVRSWNPATGNYVRAGAAWGPRGTAGFVGAYNPRSDSAGYIAGGRNVYGAWKSAGVKRGSEWARVTARENAAGGSALRWNTSNGQGFIREGRRGDIYAGRDGNVYRNTGDGWQRYNDGGWQDVGKPERGDLLNREDAGQRLQERGGSEALKNLAGAGAAGAAGAALGQRLASGERPQRDRPEAGPSRERAQNKPAQRPEAGQQRPSQRPAGAQNRPATRPSGAPNRPAARPSQPLPSNLARDMQSRNLGNQRQMAQREFSRSPSQFSHHGRSFSPPRHMGSRGGFGGGGRSFGGGRGGGGRGGGRR